MLLRDKVKQMSPYKPTQTLYIFSIYIGRLTSVWWHLASCPAMLIYLGCHKKWSKYSHCGALLVQPGRYSAYKHEVLGFVLSGGQGQFARVAGYIEPMEDPEPGETVRFENKIIGNVIPPGYLPACEKGFIEACNSGSLIGYPVEASLFSLYNIFSRSVRQSWIQATTQIFHTFYYSPPAYIPVSSTPICFVWWSPRRTCTVSPSE